MIDALIDNFAPLSVLAQSDVVALERMGHAALVRLLAVLEQEAGRYLFTHPVACYLVKLQSIPVTLSNKSLKSKLAYDIFIAIALYLVYCDYRGSGTVSYHGSITVPR